MTRNQIERKIKAKEAKITSLQKELIQLERDNLMFCDKYQWFTEKEETSGRGKRVKTVLIGRVHWLEDFIDEDNGEIISIERSRVVKREGKWL